MAYRSTGPSLPGPGALATADVFQSVVAPIALYPAALMAPILSPATFPDQVAAADYWLQQSKTLSGSPLMAAVEKQNWDPSVKALTPFPSVLNNVPAGRRLPQPAGRCYDLKDSKMWDLP